jgi:cyclic-di-GMP-binding protein
MDLRFKPIVKLTEYELPFQLTHPDLDNWLETLPAAASYSSCYEILCVLQNLYTINIELKLKLSLLQKISTCLSIHAETLEATYLDSGYPLRSVEHGNVEIIAWCYGELANNFLQILKHDKISERITKKKLMAGVLYEVVQNLGHAFLYMSEVYNQPYHGFWMLFYEAFEIAEQAILLDVDVSSGKLEQSTINNVCKKILLFELCDSNQFRPREMKKIYHLLEKLVENTELFVNKPLKNSKGLCAFNLREDKPPKNILKFNGNHGDYIRYIDTVIVAKSIYQFFKRGLTEHGSLRSINEAFFLRLIRTLGVTHKRKFTRIREDRKCSGIVGIENVMNWLEKTQSFELEAVTGNIQNVKEVATVDSRAAHNWGEVHFDLVPHDDVVLHQMYETKKVQLYENEQIKKIFAAAPLHAYAADNGIWENAQSDMNFSSPSASCEDFDIHDSSIKGYRMIWDATKLNAKIGDILGVVNTLETRVEIGLIRRINTCPEDTIQLGIELIGMKSERVYMYRPGKKSSGIWGLLLPCEEMLNITESIVFSSGDYQPGEFVCLQQGAKEVHYRLQKLLHSTSAVTHIELFLQDDL